MTHKIFFSIEAIGRTVDSSEAETSSGLDAYIELFESLTVDNDFFGLIDKEKTCLQILYQAESEKYLFETPRPDLQGSYGACYSFEEGVRILNALPKTFPLEGLSGFTFKSWY